MGLTATGGADDRNDQRLVVGGSHPFQKFILVNDVFRSVAACFGDAYTPDLRRLVRCQENGPGRSRSLAVHDLPHLMVAPAAEASVRGSCRCRLQIGQTVAHRIPPPTRSAWYAP